MNAETLMEKVKELEAIILSQSKKIDLQNVAMEKMMAMFRCFASGPGSHYMESMSRNLCESGVYSMLDHHNEDGTLTDERIKWLVSCSADNAKTEAIERGETSEKELEWIAERVAQENRAQIRARESLLFIFSPKVI